MYILDTKSIKKTVRIYTIISALCVIFSYVYEQYSYGEYSNYMRYMFMIPLIGGAVFYVIIYFSKINITRITYNLWNSAIAIFTSGMLVRGIINISGRYTEYDKVYWILGLAFMVCAIIARSRKKVDDSKRKLKTKKED